MYGNQRITRSFALIVACIVAPFATALSAAVEGIRDNSSYIATTEPLAPASQAEAFHIADVYTLQLVAAEPQIGKPVNMHFDVCGQLYVSCTSEYPLPATADAAPRDRIVRLSGIGADGRASVAETVVGDLDIPIGVLPLPRELMYFSIPDIYTCAVVAGNSRGASRKLFGPFDYTDTHGMASSFTLGLDGWVYACHGFGNESTIPLADGDAVRLSSGCTFRFRPDGSRFERFTQGQVNPFGMTFNERGDLFAADCSTKPLYTLLRGAWYPNYSRPHDGLGFGPEMMRHSHGSSGIAGVAIVSGDYYPADLAGTALIGNPVTGHINHDRLPTHGSTYRAEGLADFITCDDPWFRPVDLQLGPDGAIYIADFYNCVIGHEEVPLTHPSRDHTRGRIWRIVRRADDGTPVPPPPLPDLTKCTAEQLVAKLGDANQTLRYLAGLQLASFPAAEIIGLLRPALEDSTADASPAAALRKSHAAWLLEHAEPAGLDLAMLRALASDSAALVRIHALRILADRREWEDAKLYQLVREKLVDPDAFVRRAAADALGAHPHAANIAPLLEVWRTTPSEDRNLVHVARMALRDQLRAPGNYATAASCAADSSDNAERIAEVSLGVHSADAADFLWHYVLAHEVSDKQLHEYLHEAARYAAPPQLDEILERLSQQDLGSMARQQAALTAVVRAARERKYPLSPSLNAWAQRLTHELLTARDEKSVRRGLELAAELHAPDTFDDLAKVARTDSRHAKLRPAALDACATVDAQRAIPFLAAVVGDAAEAMTVRQKAAAALAGIKHSAASAALVEQLRLAPENLAVVIARSLSADREGSQALLDEVAAERVTRQLLNDFIVRSELSRMPQRAEQLAALTSDLPAFDARLQRLIRDRRQKFDHAEINLAAGQKVFEKVCAACHQIGGQGARIGPTLDGVGLRGVDRLIEDTLDPSRNVDPAFRTLIVVDDGKIVTGLPLRKEGELLVMANSEGREISVPADAEQSFSKISPMPANIGELIPESDYYNLLGFLLEQRQKPASR